MLQTEFEFNLPKGYIDSDGTLHKQGVMRLATAADEISPLKDIRVQNNPAYLTIIVLSRVVKNIGEIENINPKIIESLFASDLQHLQDFYHKINVNGTSKISISCPKCEHKYEFDPNQPAN